jgi:hypothetical protein
MTVADISGADTAPLHKSRPEKSEWLCCFAFGGGETIGEPLWAWLSGFLSNKQPVCRALARLLDAISSLKLPAVENYSR